MTIELESYEMDGVMLDLGSDVNILPKKSWELMGRPNLVWSPIQLRLANQYRIYPIGQLEQVEVNIEGVKTKAYFEVIEIMDDSDPYPALLGIDWEFDNNVMLNLKKRKMYFEMDTLCDVPLDLNEGDRYNEPVNEDAQSSIIENIYQITGHREDYINPTVDGELSWRSVKSYDIDSEDAMERWKNKLYEVSTRRCTNYHVGNTKTTERGGVNQLL
jgi:hypothetical protein